MSHENMELYLQEAFELHKLQIANTTLLEFGLNMGLIDQTPRGQMNVGSLNLKLMSDYQVLKSFMIELLLRLLIFITTSGMVKIAIDSKPRRCRSSSNTAEKNRIKKEEEEEKEREESFRCLNLLSILIHQIFNFDEPSLRAMNRFSMSIAMILFSFASKNTKPCKDMDKFKTKIRRRLLIDYFLWCLLFAMDLVLTCSSPIHINLEHVYGIELNISHVMLSVFCVTNLSESLQMIGQGRLAPLIIGTPLLFLDAGDNLTWVKSVFLSLYYLCFWCSDWRELVDWNHSLLCEGGICKILGHENGNLRHILDTAKSKFDNWRSDEGLDHDGWFILLDPTAEEMAESEEGSSIQYETLTDDDIGERVSEDEPEQNQNEPDPQRYANYADRIIYLQSRNPLLTSLATVILIFLK